MWGTPNTEFCEGECEMRALPYPTSSPLAGLQMIQCLHEQWCRDNFGQNADNPVEWSVLGLIEEVGELAHHQLKGMQNIRQGEDHEVGARDAVGDIFLFLLDYCTRRGWDFAEIVDEVVDEVHNRDWTKENNDE